MAIYEMMSDRIRPIDATTFSFAGVQERKDLQRLLRSQVEIIAPDTLVISEEFGDWEDSRRRIDLLGLDKDANLVVIELKRTEDGGHMELQAIRYAAMISAMTFDKAVESYASYLKTIGSADDPRDSILEFLEWEEPDEENFAQNTRLVLVSADFGIELTTAVMWLNDQGLDIRCVRTKPYSDNGRVLIDVQQVIPLPEAADYQVRIKEKASKERIDRIGRATRFDLRRQFWEGLLSAANQKMDLFANVSASKDNWIAAGSGLSGVHYVFKIRKDNTLVMFVLEAEKSENKRMFDVLLQYKSEIEQELGLPLQWKRCDELKQSNISIPLSLGGYRDNEDQWPTIHEHMVDAMTNLHRVFSKYVELLRAPS